MVNVVGRHPEDLPPPPLDAKLGPTDLQFGPFFIFAEDRYNK